jgi:TPR repeat protein/dienelactone hydrolase
MRQTLLIVSIVFSILLAVLPGRAEESWSVTRDIPLVSHPRVGDGFREEKIIADLFRPNRDGRLPAAVITNSSGGVMPFVETNYARVLASNGVVALVVDSFMPRGVRRTSDDQSRMLYSQSVADAAAGFKWLAAQPWVDSNRIIVMGMSKGAIVALDTAGDASRQLWGVTDVRFAGHIAITPGCEFQNEDARTTGAPIFFMLSELDNYTLIRPCLDYAERIRAAGNGKVRLAVYPGVFHGPEWTGGIGEENSEFFIRCSYLRDNRARLTNRVTGEIVPPASGLQAQRACTDKGPVNVGGDHRIKAQLISDLLQFLRDIDVAQDREARAIVPDCTQMQTAIRRLNCERARAGWTGDMVALARAYRSGRGAVRDEALAERLLRLAAARGHPQAQMDLADIYAFGAAPPDLARARSLAQSAAAAGEAGAMNILGVMARDGMGRNRDEKEALEWFRKSADLRGSYALANLGRMYWDGRGGLKADRSEAVKLWRRSAYYENSWGRLFLAEALEKGEGTERNVAQSLEMYRSVSNQDRDPEAKRIAQAALARLAATPPEPARQPDSQRPSPPVQQAQAAIAPNNLTFFVTSIGLGKGGDLGGLAGADAHCQSLATSVGAGSKAWRAYLSTYDNGGGGAINARDRIGRGPWQNAKGEIIAQNVDDLHSANNRLGLQTALTERGAIVNGVGMAPNNQHDVLTGSSTDGRASADMTCDNWTSSSSGRAMVGHTDRAPKTPENSTSWNSAHPSRSCSQQDLIATGGNGLFYCFAAQ